MFTTTATIERINATHTEAQRKLVADKNREIARCNDMYEYETKRQNQAHDLNMSDLIAKNNIELDKMKARYDIKEMELMAKVREANNNVEMTKANSELTIERIAADAESRIFTAERAATVVLANAQLEAIQIVAAGKARGEELAYQIAKAAQEDIKDLYEDVIETLTLRIPLEQIDLSDVRDLIAAATENFPKVVGEVRMTNNASK